MSRIHPLITGAGILLLAPVIFSACYSSFYYLPNTVQTPHLTDRNHAQVSGAFSRGNGANGGELQASWSPVRYLAVAGNGFFANSRELDFDGDGMPDAETAFKEVDGMAGAYLPLKYGTLALYGGAGKSWLSNRYAVESHADFQIARLFLQPTLSLETRSLRAGLSLRFSRLYYSSGTVEIKGLSDEDLEAIRFIEKNAPFWLPELGAHIGFRFDPCVLTLHFTNAFPSSDKWKIATYNRSLSLTFDLHKMGRSRHSDLK